MTHVIDLVAGARPNFIKVAPVMRALAAMSGVDPRVVHTGQHYAPDMNDVFFDELQIPPPFHHLDVGSGSHGVQTARIIERYEAHLVSNRPAATVVFGDVNSTAACALAAVKLGVPVVHVEAGLRSFDRTMPEEINRIVTDAISDLLLVSEPDGLKNLAQEGVPTEKVRLVGNVMIDTLMRELRLAVAANVPARFGYRHKEYGLVTLHRPSNVDDPGTLSTLLTLLRDLATRLPLIFAVHPRTRAAAERAGLQSLLQDAPGFHLVSPLPYRDNLGLMGSAKVVLTDSGGMQEETSILRVPCLTMRPNTERPITVTRGTSRLVGNDPACIRAAFDEAITDRWPAGERIPLWDGRAGDRVAAAVCDWLDARTRHADTAARQTPAGNGRPMASDLR